ncbi:hypothetical protein ATANTOWER_003380 [Ataeniobius toweri]|uniref:Uncharacterized protein n=1 Tax=Ataeniobius toweri TaxID=208326 RepID=A0ABU7BTM9_9TELE|nr:hypothetical protein [Ataeniobius toweri]
MLPACLHSGILRCTKPDKYQTKPITHEYRIVAPTSYIMKVLERLLLAHLIPGQLGMKKLLVDTTAADPREEWQIPRCRHNLCIGLCLSVSCIQLVQVFFMAEDQ